MKKKISRNFRVVVDVGEPCYVHKEQPQYEQKMKEETHDVATKIRAIFNAFQDGCAVREEWDDLEACSFCGEPWDQEPSGEQTCCRAAINECAATREDADLAAALALAVETGVDLDGDDLALLAHVAHDPQWGDARGARDIAEGCVDDDGCLPDDVAAVLARAGIELQSCGCACCGCDRPATTTDDGGVVICAGCASYSCDDDGDVHCARETEDGTVCYVCREAIDWGCIQTGAPGSGASNYRIGRCECEGHHWVNEERGSWDPGSAVREADPDADL